MHDRRPCVSVVVPVYNPGPWLRPLLDSLDAQTLPPSQWEAVFVDDGSTDGTAPLLDRWTRARAWARVIHQPNSGWPSRPRNVGLDAAQGRYVYLVDADDWLSPAALEQMVEFADKCGADVAIGKMVGIGRNVPVALFQSTVADARSPRHPLQDSMTCHSMMRREFLDDHGLRFDEDQRRLEDHEFMTRVYAAAERVSIYADNDVYWHAERDDGRGTGYRRYGADEYYTALRRCLEELTDRVPPGPRREAFVGRWLRIELVGRLQSDAVRWLPRRERERFFTDVQRLLTEFTSDDTLGTLTRTWRWPAALALSATPAEFWRAETVMATTTRAEAARRPGSASLSEAVSHESLVSAVDRLGVDEPLPATRAAPSRASALWRRCRAGVLGVVSALPGGAAHRVLVDVARTPRLLLRRGAVVSAAVASVAAGILTVADLSTFAGLSVLLSAVAVTATAWRANHSLGGGLTAALQVAALIPSVVAAALTGSAAAWLAAGIGAAGVAGGLSLDRWWRRRDVRAHPPRRGRVRIGWIGWSALATGALVVAANASALVAAGA